MEVTKKSLELTSESLQLINSFRDRIFEDAEINIPYDILCELTERVYGFTSVHCSKAVKLNLLKKYTKSEAVAECIRFYKNLGVNSWYKRVLKMVLQVGEMPVILNGDSSCIVSEYIKLITSDEMNFLCEASGIDSYVEIKMQEENSLFTIDDVATMVHELAHALSTSYNTGNTDGIIVSEVPSILLQFLCYEKNAKKNTKRALIRKNFNEINNIAKRLIMIFDICDIDGEITNDNLYEIMQEREYDKVDFIDTINEMLEFGTDVEYSARYIIGLLVCPYIIKMYRSNEKKTIKILERFFKSLENDDTAEESLNILGLDFESDTINLLLLELEDYFNENKEEEVEYDRC